jgi:2-succinyl-6-hydroxy-2,4-cyclohexadiene-1-carboxylate synthase
MEDFHVTWHFYTEGDPQSPPYLFLHGFMGEGSVWLPIMKELAADIYAVAPDLPGHGKTRVDHEEFSCDLLVRSLVDFSAERFAKPPIVVGYSMGARIALYMAQTHPDEVAGLVQESASLGIDDEKERHERLELDRKRADDIKRMGLPAFLREWYKQPIYSSLVDKPDLVAKLIEQKFHGDPEMLARTIVCLSPGAQPSLWHHLGHWQKPILIIAGERDKKYSDIARRMAAVMPTATLNIVPDAGHIVHLENYAEFSAALKFFIASVILK